MYFCIISHPPSDYSICLTRTVLIHMTTCYLQAHFVNSSIFQVVFKVSVKNDELIWFVVYLIFLIRQNDTANTLLHADPLGIIFFPF
jgi:hypothetical protein